MFLKIVCLVMGVASAINLADSEEKSIWRHLRDTIILCSIGIIARKIF